MHVGGGTATMLSLLGVGFVAADIPAEQPQDNIRKPCLVHFQLPEPDAQLEDPLTRLPSGPATSISFCIRLHQVFDIVSSSFLAKVLFFAFTVLL